MRRRAARRGLPREVVRDISAEEERAGVDARDAAEGPVPCSRAQADADLGLRPDRHRTSRNIKYFVRSTEKQQRLGRAARLHARTLRPARHPRGGEAAADRGRGGADTRGERRLPQDTRGPGEKGVLFWTTTALREHPSCSGVTSPTVITVGKQVRLAEHRGVERRIGQSTCRRNVHVEIPLQATPVSTPRTGPVRGEPDRRRRGRPTCTTSRAARAIYKRTR